MLDSFLRLLSGERPSDVIWTADISYWVNSQPESEKKEKGWDTEKGYLELCRELQCMPYYWYPKFWAGQLKPGAGIERSSETHDGKMTTQWTTPKGKLVQESRFVDTSYSEAVTRYPVSSEDDLRVLLYLLENSVMKPINQDDFNKRREQWDAYDGVPALGIPRSPLPAFFVEWAGVQNGVYLMLDEEDLVAEVFRLLKAHEEVVLDGVCNLAPPLVHFPDNITSEVYTPYFESHMAEQYGHRVKKLHEAGVRIATHLDGAVRGMLPKLASVGIDAIEALTPLPCGDVDVEEMRGLAGHDDVILWGGVPGAMFAPPFTWDDMRKHVLKVLETWKGQRFVLGVADQVPPNGDISYVKRISELCSEASVG